MRKGRYRKQNMKKGFRLWDVWNQRKKRMELEGPCSHKIIIKSCQSHLRLFINLSTLFFLLLLFLLLLLLLFLLLLLLFLLLFIFLLYLRTISTSFFPLLTYNLFISPYFSLITFMPLTDSFIIPVYLYNIRRCLTVQINPPKLSSGFQP